MMKSLLVSLSLIINSVPILDLQNRYYLCYEDGYLGIITLREESIECIYNLEERSENIYIKGLSDEQKRSVLNMNRKYINYINSFSKN